MVKRIESSHSSFVVIEIRAGSLNFAIGLKEKWFEGLVRFEENDR